jgi:hypothetical protein
MRKATRAGPPERWEPAPPSPRTAEAVEEQAPVAGVEAPAAGRSTEEAERVAEVSARTTEVSACAAEASRGATVAESAVASAPAEPSRKRKRGFSTLR